MYLSDGVTDSSRAARLRAQWTEQLVCSLTCLPDRLLASLKKTNHEGADLLYIYIYIYIFLYDCPTQVRPVFSVLQLCVFVSALENLKIYAGVSCTLHPLSHAAGDGVVGEPYLGIGDHG